MAVQPSRCSRLPAITAILCGALLCGCEALQKQAPVPEPAPPPEPPPPAEVVISDELRAVNELQQQINAMDQHLQAIQQQIGDLQKMIPQRLAAPTPPLQKPPVPARPMPPPPMKQIQGKTLAGNVEWLWVQNIEQSLPARMNTGSPSSFIHVRELNLYERDGERWVSFAVNYEAPQQSETPAPLAIDVKVERMSRSRAQPENKREAFPVIKLLVRLGGLQQVADFALTEKPFGKEPIALGRNFLKDLVVVDVSEEFLQPKYVPQKPAPTNAEVSDSQSEQPGT